VEEVIARLKQVGLGHVPVVVGGIIPAEDEAQLKAAGVARVYTPKDFDLTQIMREIVDVVDGTNKSAA
jgi:(2R)-ethylmalonyl-CoA mutase